MCPWMGIGIDNMQGDDHTTLVQSHSDNRCSLIRSLYRQCCREGVRAVALFGWELADQQMCR